MTRKFETVDYEAALDQTVSLREALPASHLARFVVDVVAELNLRSPTPPSAEPQDKDPYNFTDPESRIMKSSRGGGFEQAYNSAVQTSAPLAVRTSVFSY